MTFEEKCNRMIISTGPNSQSDLRKGWWMFEDEDFVSLTTLGQKEPSKRDKFMIVLSNFDEEDICGACDYNTARIIHILLRARRGNK